MKISVVTVFPQLYSPFLETSLLKRAQQEGKIQCAVSDYFSYVAPKERIDGPTFGPTPGMLIKPEVVERAILDHEQRFGPAYKIFFSPHGTKLDQQKLQKIATESMHKGHLMLLPARYEGMDARVEEEYADCIISVGDFVLMAGDAPALMVLEGLVRLLPGVVGKEASVTSDSFSGPFVDYPEYTAPVEWHGKQVPEVIRSGDHKKIEMWRKKVAIERTVAGHFEWLRSWDLPVEDRLAVKAAIPPHYAVLLHDQVLLPEGKVGTTSVTSLDLHDIARSARTYGLQGYYLVTPLHDQQKIVKTLLAFWKEGSGVLYNPHRHEAVSATHLVASLDEACQAIAQETGKQPLLVATSAKNHQMPPEKCITFQSHSQVWREGRPVVFLFGTGHGIAQTVLDKCDFMLPPVYGLSAFNHLSVRSAAAIIFDRWLGVNPTRFFRSN
jgi:tRNA (guanine37-N1)-methyltransferase